LTGFFAKHPAELAGAEPGNVGQGVHRQIMGEVFTGIGQGQLHAVGLWVQFQQGRQLRLLAAAALGNHQLACNAPGQAAAQVVLHHRQRQVDPGAHARTGPHLAVDNEQLVFFQVDIRIAFAKCRRMDPVGGGALARQQACLGQYKDAHA